MTRPALFAYVSGHGFGHWTRSEAVLERLAARADVHVRTADRPLVWARRARWAASVAEVDVGPGVAQQGPLRVDVPATRAALAAHLRGWDDTVAAEVAAARALRVRGVYADVPPVAFAVAAALGVPSLALANFSWSWIYAHYAPDPLFEEAASRLRACEGLATRLVALPGGGGLDAFGPVPPPQAIRRPTTRERAEARALLPRPARSRGASPGAAPPLVLLSFGGFGDELDLSAGARSNPDLDFVSFAAPRGEVPPNLAVLPHLHDLPHQDLVLGADCLLAKPGYGTISECLAGPTPMAYTVPDGAFREHLELVRLIERWLPSAPLEPEALRRGAWGPALARAMAARPAEPPPPNGLDEAVRAAEEALLGGWAGFQAPPPDPSRPSP